MTNYTSRLNLPYPTSADPVARTPAIIQQLAEALDSADWGQGPVKPPLPQTDLADIRREVFGGDTRNRRPLCALRLTATDTPFTSETGQPYVLNGRFSADVDTDNMYTNTGTVTYIRVPVAGRYEIAVTARLHDPQETYVITELRVNDARRSVHVQKLDPMGRNTTVLFTTKLTTGDRVNLRWYNTSGGTTRIERGTDWGEDPKIVVRFLAPR